MSKQNDCPGEESKWKMSIFVDSHLYLVTARLQTSLDSNDTEENTHFVCVSL